MDYEKYSKASAPQQDKWDRQLALWIAVHLGAVPPFARARVMTLARQLVGSRDVDAPDTWKAIPAAADIDLASGLVTGMGALQAAVMGQPAEDVQQIVQDAESIAAGTALHGDPSGRATLPSMAAVVLDSAINAGEPDLEDPSVATALFSVAQAYDCAAHNLPLGGGLADLGNKIKSWWKGLTGTDEEKAAYQAEKAARAASKATAAEQEAQKARLNALLNAGFSFDDASKMAATGGAENDKSKEADVTIDEAVIPHEVSPAEALSRFKAALKTSQSTVEQAKEQAEDASAQLTKLRWAEAPLNAGKEAAELLRDVTPDFSSPSAAIQTAFDVLLAAKESGSVPRIRLITRLLTSSRKKDGQFGEWLSSLLSGDPDVLTEGLKEAEGDANFAKSLDEVLRQKGVLQSLEARAVLPVEVLNEIGEI